MTIVASLLDKYRECRSLASDNALALDLGVTRQVVSQWRAGSSYPGDHRIAQMAEGCKEDAGVWLAQVHAERAGQPEKAAWESIVRRLLPIMSTAARAVRVALGARA